MKNTPKNKRRRRISSKMGKTVLLALISVLSFLPAAVTSEVFFSCCRSGDDTTLSNFTDNLATAFRRAGLFVSCGEEDGALVEETIGLAARIAIYESKLAVILLSKQYANSTLCLEELAIIMRRRRISNGAYAVVPLFYHVHPSDVAEQEGPYGEALAGHEKQLSLKTDMAADWTAALKEIGDVKGIYISENSNESQHMQRIVGEIDNKLNQKVPSIASYFSWDVIKLLALVLLNVYTLVIVHAKIKEQVGKSIRFLKGCASSVWMNLPLTKPEGA